MALGIDTLIWFGVLEGAMWLIRHRRQREGVVETDHVRPVPSSDLWEAGFLILLMAAITINLWFDPLRIAYRSELQAVSVSVISAGFVVLGYLICPVKPRFGKAIALLLSVVAVCLMIMVAARLYLRLHSESAQDRIKKNLLQIEEAVKKGQ